MAGDTTTADAKCILKVGAMTEATTAASTYTEQVGICKVKSIGAISSSLFTAATKDMTPDACKAACDTKTECTAYQVDKQGGTALACLAFTEISEMAGVPNANCFVRPNKDSAFVDNKGFCKIKSDSSVSTNLDKVTDKDKDAAACKAACTTKDTCLAYQTDITTAATEKCITYTETAELKGVPLDINCFTKAKSTSVTDPKYLAAVEKSTLIQHYMVSFTARMAHLQLTLDKLPANKKALALINVGQLPKPTGITAETTY